ncbi:MAG: 4-hydroxythreonine-4-phosphate dehydrogenase PdxA [Planctomycetota bacterium]
MNAQDAHPDPLPTLAVSMGDPLSIAPEVTVKALRHPTVRDRARFIVFGSHAAMTRAAELVHDEPFWWRVPAGSGLVEHASGRVVLIDFDEMLPPPSGPPAPSKAGGAASFAYVEHAIEACKGKSPLADALVTAPVSKEAWALAGRGKYPGHTELLATRFQAKRTRMSFVSPELRVVLATAHVPLMEIRNHLTIGRVFDSIDMAADLCRDLGVERPRIAVCGLNPHAGEGGLLGDEDGRVIEPAVRHAQEVGIEASGPHPGDTVFNAALKGTFDAVVAMYHDQGLIPVKLLAFDRAVNTTLGLGAVRTSPDHGTAYDIAGRGIADPGSMTSAVSLAIDLVRARGGAPVSSAR